MFTLYEGDTGDLPTTKNHLVFKAESDEFNILFSITQHGKAASCHFSSDSDGLRHLKSVMVEFVEFVFNSFEWCRMIIANIKRPSVGRVVEKIGFTPFATYTGGISYMRVK